MFLRFGDKCITYPLDDFFVIFLFIFVNITATKCLFDISVFKVLVMEVFKKYFFTIYMLLIGASAGAILALGAFSAPVIFHVNDYVSGISLSAVESGMIMTQLFLKLNYLLEVLAVYMIVFEMVGFFIVKERAGFTFFLGVLIVGAIFLFTRYFTPIIINAQEGGMPAVGSAEFQRVHLYSEVDFKFLMAALVIMFIHRVKKEIG